MRLGHAEVHFFVLPAGFETSARHCLGLALPIWQTNEIAWISRRQRGPRSSTDAVHHCTTSCFACFALYRDTGAGQQLYCWPPSPATKSKAQTSVGQAGPGCCRSVSRILTVPHAEFPLQTVSACPHGTSHLQGHEHFSEQTSCCAGTEPSLQLTSHT